jgi:hypothetical protein
MTEEEIKEMLKKHIPKPDVEPILFFSPQQYEEYNKIIEAELKPYIKIKDPFELDKPRGNNFTPKKKKRRK